MTEIWFHLKRREVGKRLLFTVTTEYSSFLCGVSDTVLEKAPTEAMHWHLLPWAEQSSKCIYTWKLWLVSRNLQQECPPWTTSWVSKGGCTQGQEWTGATGDHGLTLREDPVGGGWSPNLYSPLLLDCLTEWNFSIIDLFFWRSEWLDWGKLKRMKIVLRGVTP